MSCMSDCSAAVMRIMTCLVRAKGAQVTQWVWGARINGSTVGLKFSLAGAFGNVETLVARDGNPLGGEEL